LELCHYRGKWTLSVSAPVTTHSYNEDERKSQVKFQNFEYQINFKLNPHNFATTRKLGKVLCPVTVTCQWFVVWCSFSKALNKYSVTTFDQGNDIF
jgi:hypothetical protein